MKKDKNSITAASKRQCFFTKKDAKMIKTGLGSISDFETLKGAQEIIISFTKFKSINSLSKRYWVKDGVIEKKAVAQMYTGTSDRVTMPFVDLHKALTKATDKHAFGYGLHPLNYPNKVKIAVSGKEQPEKNIISRTQKFYKYLNQSGVVMIDHDPNEYGQAMTADALLAVLIAIHPDIAQMARVVRGSVSAGVHKTGESPRTDKGFHIYIPVKNAADLPRYGKVLFDRLWLSGFGFVALASNGAALVRTVIDGAVFSPERLDFVGKPIISGAGLEYTPPAATYTEGGVLDTETLPDLTDDEQAEVKRLIADAKAAIKPTAATKQTAWEAAKVETMTAAGVPVEKALAAIKQLLIGGCKDLHDDFILEFTTGAVSVSDVLKNPQAYDDKALADPVEGIAYGATTAKFYYNNGDKPFINSQAHGGCKYFLHQTPVANSANLLICEPEPLRAPLPKAEPYPVETLGDVLGPAARALHESVKAPLALCCQSVLASASLAAQAHFDVMLPWGQKKPLSLFLLSVAESGERKSGIDDVVLGAAKAQERQDMSSYQIELEQYEVELARWKAESDQKNKKSSSKSQAASDYAAAAAHDNPKPKAPIMPLRFVTEPTVEGLYKLLAVGQPSVGLFSDEAGLLIGGHAMNSDNALKTMARLCKFWDGASFDRVRAGDGSGSLYGRRLAMHQQAQPDVMAKLLSDPMANGQGFLARCLVAWPESTIGNRYIDQFEWPGDRQGLKRLFTVLVGLMQAEPRTAISEQELDPVELLLDEDAKEMAMQALNKFETLMQSGNDLFEIRERTAKAVENACRIAGVLAVVDGGMATRSIGTKHLAQSLTLIQWYLKEALRIRGAAVIPQAVTDAESLSKWLDGRGCRMFRTALVLTKGPSHLRNKTRLNTAIKELVDNGYLAPNEPGTIINGISTRKSWSVQHVV